MTHKSANKNTSNCCSLSLRRQTATTCCLFNVKGLLSLILTRPRSFAAPSLPRREGKRTWRGRKRLRTSENQGNVYWVYLVLGFDWWVFAELWFTSNFSSPSGPFGQSGTVGKLFNYQVSISTKITSCGIKIWERSLVPMLSKYLLIHKYTNKHTLYFYIGKQKIYAVIPGGTKF